MGKAIEHHRSIAFPALVLEIFEEVQREVIALGKTKTTSYILTFPLKTERFQEHILNKRFEIGRRIYNACLGEYLKRYNVMISDNEFKETITQVKSKEYNKKLSDIRNNYGLTEYSMHDFVKSMQHLFKSNIDAFTAQKIATRAWQTIEKLMFGDAVRVYFKRFNEIDSLEGKTNGTGIRFKDDLLLWNGLTIPVIIKENDTYAHQALQDRVKYCRIQRKLIRGKVK